ncbi:hypothetical protein LguiB_025378 [Lonicera macranthoides]
MEFPPPVTNFLDVKSCSATAGAQSKPYIRVVFYSRHHAGNFFVTPERFKYPAQRTTNQRFQSSKFSACCLLGVAVPPCIEPLDATISGNPFYVHGITHINTGETLHGSSELLQRLLVADLDPATAKLAIGFLGPFLSAFAFLFIIRIVMSWYPKLPVGKFPYVLAYAPTEPILGPTRKLIPPVGGVDVTPVVWFGLVSFLNEILVGPQGLLVLLSQQV